MSHRDIRGLVYLAAFVHDIGKFYQRADPDRLGKSKRVDVEIKNLTGAYCPHTRQGYPTHQHVIWTAQWIKDMGIEWEHEGVSLMSLAGRHHKPGNLLESIIQKADHLSSGMDRTKDTSPLETESDEQQSTFFKDVRMRSVFEYIFQEKSGAAFAGKHWIDLKALSTDRQLFPQTKFAHAPNYNELWSSFMRYAEQLPKKDFVVFTESLSYLLEYFTSTIPSSTQDLPDVSLYDHLRTTGGLALALYDYMCEKDGAEKIHHGNGGLPSPDEEAFMLIGADLSGIQSFIYKISSKGAAKALKGRSFYLQLVLTGLLQKLMYEMKLFRGSIIYDSGGGFYLLAANTKANQEKIAEVRKKINRWLFKQFETQLYVSLDFVTLSERNLIAQKGPQMPPVGEQVLLPEKWKELSDKLSARKARKFSELCDDDDLFANLFEPGECLPKEKRDVITGEPIEGQVQYFQTGSGDNLGPLKRATKEQLELGKKLKEADGLMMILSPSGQRPPGFHLEMDWQDTLWSVVPVPRNHPPAVFPQALQTSYIRLNALPRNLEEEGIIQGFSFFGGNDFPTDHRGDIKTFDQLAGGKGDEKFRRLGILRMDVDNLGAIFQKGFIKEKITFSRLATLSRSLDLFFKGYLNDLVGLYHEHVYVIYSGGDDLFLIGKWDEVIKLSADIRDRFREYTCANPHIGLSGGVVLVPAKYPIKKAAEHAESAEKIAKKNHFAAASQLYEKDSLSLFGIGLHWTHEFPLVEKLKNDLCQLIDTEVFSKSIISRLVNFYEMAQEQKAGGKSESWRWLLAYNLSQYSHLRGNDTDAKDWLEDFKKAVFADTDMKGGPLKSHKPFLQLAAIAARWAELELRNKD